MFAAVGGYGAREVAKMLGLSVAQVRAYVKAGFLTPSRGPRNELRFSFQDLVLLRTAKGLVSARIPPRRVRTALRKLRSQLPEGRPAARGAHPCRRRQHRRRRRRRAVERGVRAGALRLQRPRAVAQGGAAACCMRAARPTGTSAAATSKSRSPREARSLIARRSSSNPSLADAWVNLGRLLHEVGRRARSRAALSKGHRAAARRRHRALQPGCGAGRSGHARGGRARLSHGARRRRHLRRRPLQSRSSLRAAG